MKLKWPFPIGEMYVLWICITILSIPYWIMFSFCMKDTFQSVERFEKKAEEFTGVAASLKESIDKQTKEIATLHNFTLNAIEEERDIHKEELASFGTWITTTAEKQRLESLRQTENILADVESIKPPTIRKLEKLLNRLEKSDE